MYLDAPTIMLIGRWLTQPCFWSLVGSTSPYRSCLIPGMRVVIGNFDVQVILYPLIYLGIATDCCSLPNLWTVTPSSLLYSETQMWHRSSVWTKPVFGSVLNELRRTSSPLPCFIVVSPEVASALVGPKFIVIYFILLQKERPQGGM